MGDDQGESEGHHVDPGLVLDQEEGDGHEQEAAGEAAHGGGGHGHGRDAGGPADQGRGEEEVEHDEGDGEGGGPGPVHPPEQAGDQDEHRQGGGGPADHVDHDLPLYRRGLGLEGVHGAASTLRAAHGARASCSRMLASYEYHMRAKTPTTPTRTNRMVRTGTMPIQRSRPYPMAPRMAGVRATSKPRENPFSYPRYSSPCSVGRNAG